MKKFLGIMILSLLLYGNAYGKIFTLKNILDNVQSTRLKIQLHQKRLQI